MTFDFACRSSQLTTPPTLTTSQKLISKSVSFSFHCLNHHFLLLWVFFLSFQPCLRIKVVTLLGHSLFGNFSKFPRFENHFHFSLSAAPSNNDTGQPYKDWVFINYTFKRFEGLTQRGPPIKMAKEVVAQTPKWSEGSLLHFWSCKMIRRLSFAKFARCQQKIFLKQKWGNVATEWSLEIWKQNQFEIYNMIFTQKKTWSENHEKMQSPPLCIALLDSELSIIVIFFFKLEQQSRYNIQARWSGERLVINTKELLDWSKLVRVLSFL